jgi:hypothetical protein
MPQRKENPDRRAMLKAFEKRIKEHYTMLDCFNEYTLLRDERGNYKNMSVSMDLPDFVAGWDAAKKYFTKGSAK